MKHLMTRPMAAVAVRVTCRAGLAMGILVSCLLVAAPPAQADSIFYSLTSDHCTGTCGTPPFGYVQLTQNGTTVDFTVHLFSPNKFVQTGSGDFQAFKFNGSGVVLGDITVAAHTPSWQANTGDFDGDGGGTFNFGISCPDCGNGGSNAFAGDIVFHVANATIAELTALNDKNQVFVADIIGANGNTGLVDATTGGPNPPPDPIPEPGTLLLLGSGLAGLVALRMRSPRV